MILVVLKPLSLWEIYMFSCKNIFHLIYARFIVIVNIKTFLLMVFGMFFVEIEKYFGRGSDSEMKVGRRIEVRTSMF